MNVTRTMARRTWRFPQSRSVHDDFNHFGIEGATSHAPNAGVVTRIAIHAEHHVDYQLLIGTSANTNTYAMPATVKRYGACAACIG